MCIDCDDVDLNKRSFLTSAAAAVVGAALTSKTFGQQISSTSKALDDPNIIHQAVTFKNGADTIKGYLARPKKEGRYRAVVVAHGNPGISEDIRNATAQMAQAGYVGLAVDWNSRAGDDTGKLDKPLEFYVSNAFDQQNMRDTQAGIDYLQAQSFVKGKKVGLLGFCGGGNLCLRLSTVSKDVKTVVAFYAPPVFHPPRVSVTDPRPNLIDIVDQIKVPIQCHFGTVDKIIPFEDVQKFERELRANKVKVEFYTYEDAGHAFYDYRRAHLYNAAAANLSHSRMLNFLKNRLG